jgi:hypothetical protein
MTALRASSLFNGQRGPFGDWGKSSGRANGRETIVCGGEASVKRQHST